MVIVSLLSAVNESSRDRINKKLKINYLDKLYTSYFEGPESMDMVDPESQFNRKIDRIYQEKRKDDEENNLWILDSDINAGLLNIPPYYYDMSKKPPILPFDIRFTLGMYAHHLRSEAKNKPKKPVSAPFHWYDWVDLSVLDQYLLANPLEKPTCAFLDAREDEIKLNKEKEQKDKEKDKELKEFEQKELNKEQDKQKIEEAEKKIEETKLEENIEKQLQSDNKEPQKEEKKEEEKKEDVKKEDEKKEGEKKEGEKKDEQNANVDEKKEESEQENKDNLNQNANLGDNKEAKKEESDKENKETPAQENLNKVEENQKDKIEKRLDKREAVDPKEFCLDDFHLPSDFQDGNSARPGFNVFKSDLRTTPDKAILLGKSYLYTFAPPPSMIVFLTKEGSYNITVKGREKLLDSDIVNNYLSQNKKKSIDPVKEFSKLKKNLKPNTHQSITDYEVHLSEDSFILNHEKWIAEYEEKINNGGISLNEFRYLQSLKYSDHEVKNGGPPKYFAEARLIGSLVGDHYDWRFFNGVMYESSKRSLVLHRLIRSWLSFCRKNGVNSWVAHGSLLSWYWNGFSFPWDYDIDVQVPIMDLHKLSVQFNQTLVVEDMDEGYGRYFLDCGSFITLRSKGNGNNNIDARFIDIDTGIYIDITGLAASNTKSPDRYKDIYPDQWADEKEDYTQTNIAMKAYNCRNNHFSTLDELSPLVKTYVEGEMAYVPRRYTDILTVEYPKGLLSKKYSGHIFVPQLRLWVKERDLYYFLHDKQKWKTHNYNEEYYNIVTMEDFEKDNVRYEVTEIQKAKLLSEAAERKKLGRLDPEPTKLSDRDLHTIHNFKTEQLLELLSKDDLFIYYYLTRDFTTFHQEEAMRLLFSKSTEKLLSSQPKFKPFTTDLLDYYMHNNDYNYDDKVNKYIALSVAYSGSQSQSQAKPVPN